MQPMVKPVDVKAAKTYPFTLKHTYHNSKLLQTTHVGWTSGWLIKVLKQGQRKRPHALSAQGPGLCSALEAQSTARAGTKRCPLHPFKGCQHASAASIKFSPHLYLLTSAPAVLESTQVQASLSSQGPTVATCSFIPLHLCGSPFATVTAASRQLEP